MYLCVHTNTFYEIYNYGNSRLHMPQLQGNRN